MIQKDSKRQTGKNSKLSHTSLSHLSLPLYLIRVHHTTLIVVVRQAHQQGMALIWQSFAFFSPSVWRYWVGRRGWVHNFIEHTAKPLVFQSHVSECQTISNLGKRSRLVLANRRCAHFTIMLQCHARCRMPQSPRTRTCLCLSPQEQEPAYLEC